MAWSGASPRGQRGARLCGIAQRAEHGKGISVASDRKRDLRPEEGGSRTVYLVTPVTYDGEKAEAEEVAQAFDRLVKGAIEAGALQNSGVESVGFSVIQPTGEEIPLGIEPPPESA